MIEDDDEPWGGRSDAALAALVAQMRDVQPKAARSPRLKVQELGIDENGPLFEPYEGVGLNQTVSLVVELPAYMVAGLMVRGVVSNERLRQFVREGLVRSGDTWWQPRWVSAQKAKMIEGWFTEEKG